MHLDVIEKKTINEMAEACFVLKAKISYFCKALGYDNFIAVKEDCAKEKYHVYGWQVDLSDLTSIQTAIDYQL